MRENYKNTPCVVFVSIFLCSVIISQIKIILTEIIMRKETKHNISITLKKFPKKNSIENLFQQRRVMVRLHDNRMIPFKAHTIYETRDGRIIANTS